MPKRASKRTGPARAIVFLTVIAIALFVGGEAAIMSRTDGWRVAAARHLGIGDPARVTRMVGRGIAYGLSLAGVPRDSIRERVASGGAAPIRIRAGLKPGASLLQANYAVTRNVEASGAVVLSGREQAGPHGEAEVTLVVGLPKRATHEVTLVRPLATAELIADAGGKLSLVLYGLDEEPEASAKLLEASLPFTAALVPGRRESKELLRAARAAQREVVLHLPLEPINYPQVNPGPGTVLVTMKPAKIVSLVDRYLDEAGPVTAIANHMGSLATQDMSVMTAVYGELKRRNLPFLHMQPAAGSVCRQLSSELGIAYQTPDEVIDLETRGGKGQALESRWKKALARARERGQLIVMLRASPRVREWLPRALAAERRKGVSIVPLESLMRKPSTL